MSRTSRDVLSNDPADSCFGWRSNNRQDKFRSRDSKSSKIENGDKLITWKAESGSEISSFVLVQKLRLCSTVCLSILQNVKDNRSTSGNKFQQIHVKSTKPMLHGVNIFKPLQPHSTHQRGHFVCKEKCLNSRLRFFLQTTLVHSEFMSWNSSWAHISDTDQR